MMTLSSLLKQPLLRFSTTSTAKNDDLTGDFHTVARHLCIDCAAITSSDLSRAGLVTPDVRAWTSYEDKKYYIEQYGRAGRMVKLVSLEQKLGAPVRIRYEKLADCGDISLRKYRSMALLREENRAAMTELLQAVRQRNGLDEFPKLARYDKSTGEMAALMSSLDTANVMVSIDADTSPIFVLSCGVTWCVTDAISYNVDAPDEHVIYAYRWVKHHEDRTLRMEKALLRVESIDRWATSLHELGESWVDANGVLW